jgi:thiol-disulfide isomerase/thioredoxin
VTQAKEAATRSGMLRWLIVGAVVAVFVVLIVSKTMPAADGAAEVAGTAPATAKLSESHADANAGYAAAIAKGKPVYLLFHSLTCQPCIEISAVVDKVMPGYADKVTFVNAISDAPGSQELASKFKFQYIPTSFFIEAQGKIVDSFTGAMDEAEMKARLDKLTAQ